MTQKHITIDGRYLLRQQRGMPLYVYNLCKRLPAQLPDVVFTVLINSQFEHNEASQFYSDRLNEIRNLPNVTILDIRSEGEIFWETIKLPIWLIKKRPDLLLMPGNRVSLLSCVKQFATFHDAMEWKYFDELFKYNKDSNFKVKLYQFRVRLYIWLTYKIGLSRLSKVLTISNFSKKSLESYFPKIKNKTCVLYHGIPDGFSSEKNNIVAHSERHGVLMLGGDSYQKNPENAIRAWHALPDDLKKNNPLTIAGTKNNDGSPIRKVITELNIQHNLVVKEWVSEAELITLFRHSKALLFVSREEGFGFPLVQAMACGTPTVVSKAEVLLELGGDAVCLAETEDYKKISAQLEQLLLDARIWNDKSKASLIRAESFNWDSMIKQLAEIIISEI